MGEKRYIKPIYENGYHFFCNIINREIKKKKKIILLDYGCGDGYWTHKFSRFSNLEIVGVDYNPLRLKRVRKSVKNIQFIEANLRLENKSLGFFDIVFCS